MLKFIILLLFLFQCQSTEVVFDSTILSPIEQSKYSDKSNMANTNTTSVRYGSVVFGYFEVTNPVATPCNYETKSIVMQKEFLDGVIHFFIGGIYTTRMVYIYCP